MQTSSAYRQIIPDEEDGALLGDHNRDADDDYDDFSTIESKGISQRTAIVLALISLTLMALVCVYALGGKHDTVYTNLFTPL